MLNRETGHLVKIKDEGITVVPNLSSMDMVGSGVSVTAIDDDDVTTSIPGGSSISGTINEVAYFDSATSIASLAVATYPSLAELAYVKGVTSGIQGQIDSKAAALHTQAASTITDFDTEVANNSAVAANTAKVTNATHTGDVTGATALTIAAGAVDIAMLSATGTPGGTTYLRGDNTWATIAGGGDVSKVGTPVNDQVGVWTGDGTIEGDAALTYDATTDTLTSVTFSGNLTGNVTGNVSGTAATVTEAAQTAITSLGTLTTLTVDDITINGNTISSAGASTLAITPTAGQAITFDGTVTLDAGVIAGATSITSTSFVGALTGNADTATALETARAINGVNFDGTAAITVTAAAGTLTGTTLKSTVVTSSLTSVGTIATGVWNGTDIAVADGGTGSSTAAGAATNLGLGTGDSPQFTGIELGHATDTTLSRSAAGVLAVEGKVVATEFSKSITVESPTASEDISVFFTNKAITITEIRAVLVGSATPSVTWTIRHGTDRSATGAEVVTGGTTTTLVTTGSDVTSFNDATIIADSFVWLETTASSGTVGQIHITIKYTLD